MSSTLDQPVDVDTSSPQARTDAWLSAFESALAARTGGLEVHVVHVPNAANGLIKPLTLAAGLRPDRRDYRIYRDRARAAAA